MTNRELLLFFAMGAGTIALWLDLRFPGLVPEGGKRRLVHAIVSLAAAQLIVPTAMKLLFAVDDSTPFVLLGLFALFLPALVYAFLSGIWLMRLLRGALP
jgi:hypothetical protein